MSILNTTARRVSPPLRHGVYQSPDGQYVGYTYFEPINGSASPVLHAYGPYPTQLYAPQYFDGVSYATALYLNSLRNRGSFLAMQQGRTKPNGASKPKAPSQPTPAAPPAPAAPAAPAANPDDFYKGMNLQPQTQPAPTSSGPETAFERSNRHRRELSNLSSREELGPLALRQMGEDVPYLIPSSMSPLSMGPHWLTATPKPGWGVDWRPFTPRVNTPVYNGMGVNSAQSSPGFFSSIYNTLRGYLP